MADEGEDWPDEGTIYLVCLHPKDDFEEWKTDILFAIDRVEEKREEARDDWDEPRPVTATVESVIKELNHIQLIGATYSSPRDEWDVLEALLDDNDHTIEQFDTFKYGGQIRNVCDRHAIRRMNDILKSRP